ncbi:hypothetical protein CSB45_03020 [candidate division KSB3 bacterium]|uniref:Methyl-accepting transducer domain-containing protein n=1 Tax=candidate division KSB3 bacterium TaxID=2044937 RepID=A0A2G6E8W0_9BACT|nr:MAG: hypothetical protein CSB45_03020 [candidate division KSB3 bacterium]
MTYWLNIKNFTVRSLLVVGSIILLVSGLQLFYVQHVLRETEFLFSSLPMKLYIGLCLIDTLLLLGLWVGILKLYHVSITRPSKELAPVIRDMQTDHLDLVSYLKDTGCSDIHLLAQASEHMLQRVKSLISQVHEIGQHILKTSRSIFATSKKQSQHFAYQAGSSGDLTSAIQELILTTELISDGVSAVVKLAGQTLQFTEQGQQSVQAVVKSMEDIHHSSQVSSNKIMALSKQSGHINEVVKTIDRMIEDTKLIAFNATIEAARAKDQGRGFSVVSLEIKRLAEGVFESTEAIKELIQDILETSHALVMAHEEEMKTVHRGTLLVEKAGTSLEHIFEMLRSTTDSAQHIVTAAQQQQSANTMVLQSVEQARQSMNRFSLESQQLARASAELNILAEGLGQLLSGYTPQNSPGE